VARSATSTLFLFCVNLALHCNQTG
jgi:hypothetical protein